MNREKAKKFLQLAKYQAELFSKDPNRKVATILLSKDTLNILSTGYNGLPRGMNDDNEERWVRPTKYWYVTHSEINSICSAARNGTKVDGAIAVVTMFPCSDCAKALIQAGVKTIVSITPNIDESKWGEHFKISLEMFEELGIELILFDPSDI